ncbi:MAG: exodeoxyribonuclease V subunit alpha [Halothiobacillaceae bacterium]|jgi:exodeoxyribonuclease V alpha subunit|nr:exodeoxyribonuclease V subunit alpha [Halothiobacillaceae bacterium]
MTGESRGAVEAARREAAGLLALLAQWVEAGWLRELDRAFAAFLHRECPQAPPLLLAAAALVSHQLGRGHACLDLRAILDDPRAALSLPETDEARPEDALAPPTPAALLAGVRLPELQAVLAHPALVAHGEGETPLVLDGERLYLRRFWRHERRVREAVTQRLAEAPEVDPQRLRPLLDALFPPGAGEPGTSDWQKIACAMAARQRFAVITGGPGTGKTTTVLRLLALLQAQALQARGDTLVIRLAAPTGKAAARLNESIVARVRDLPVAGLPEGETVRAAVPQDVVTLHRLLGTRPDTRRFAHHAGNPLALDVLVVDEASMIDLEMMAAVLDALPPDARLILLGDKDQLASVEAGAVLGELCARAEAGHYTAQSVEFVREACGERIAPGLCDPQGQALDQAIVMLRRSHRFDAGSGIGRLAAAVNAGDVDAARAVFAASPADLRLIEPRPAVAASALRRWTVEGEAGAAPGYAGYLRALRETRPPADAPPEVFDAWASALLRRHADFQVLCALRQGPWGVDGLNRRIAAMLRAEGCLPAAEDWYPGRPVLVTRNDYALGLMNGDIGIALPLPRPDSGEWMLRVAFPRADGTPGVRWILPARLQAVETVFALTVHKSQGSEFTHAVLVLPPSPSPILTRELVYTGLTRARESLTLFCPGPSTVLDEAIRRRVVRSSGLRAEGG